jgi:KRAB domain-containing zinc finger protein
MLFCAPASHFTHPHLFHLSFPHPRSRRKVPNSAVWHKSTHTRDKPYKCDICNKIFSESHKLTQHKISAHKRNESFECGICKKTFTKRQSLKRHWRSHLRDGLLLCHTCGKEIIQGQRHDMLMRYRVMIILSVTNATNSSLILKVYISERPKTMVHPTNVMSVRN